MLKQNATETARAPFGQEVVEEELRNMHDWLQPDTRLIMYNIVSGLNRSGEPRCLEVVTYTEERRH